jgi:hypothetical protein
MKQLSAKKEFYKKLNQASLKDWRRWLYAYEKGWRPPKECLWSFEFLMNTKQKYIKLEDFNYYRRASYLLTFGTEYKEEEKNEVLF